MTETNLKEILKTLFSIDDEHLVPITTNWFVPRIKPGTNEDTIGYRIQSKSIREEKGRKYLRTNFRLSFVGEHAEELSQEVLLWQCCKWKKSTDIRFFLTSLDNIELVKKSIRLHWEIENRQFRQTVLRLL